MLERPMLQHPLHLGRFALERLLLASILALLVLGCGAPTNARTVSDVTLLERSPSALDTDDALGGLATAAPRKILWIERERDVYDANVVGRDLERIERYYRAHGYYDVKVVAARVETVGEREVKIEVHVTPGPRVTVRKVFVDPATLLELPPDVAFKYKDVPQPRAGEPFTEEQLTAYEGNLLEMLKEAGFAYATVKATAKVDLNARAADIIAEMKAGKRARLGEIRITGLQQIPESKVRAALRLKRGSQYSEAELLEAQNSLEEMQVFTRAQVTPDLSNPELENVPILVSVQEDKLRRLTLGGGTVIDALKLEAHVRTGWEHRNFVGGARKLTVEATGGVILFPNRLEGLDHFWMRPTNDFWVLDSQVSLEQPAVFGGRTKGTVEAGYSRRPVLYSLGTPFKPRDEVVIGFHKPRGKLGLERSFVDQRISLAPSYNLLARLPFGYQNLPSDANLITVWVSYPALFSLFQTKPGDLARVAAALTGGDPARASRDKRRRDFNLSFRNTVQVAGLKLNGTRYLGGSVSDVKIEPELRTAAPIFPKRSTAGQKAPDVLLATRIKFGFLIAPDYGSTLRTDQSATIAGTDEELKAQLDRDQQYLLSRAFYSGGSTSNRGYAQDSISPHGPVGFLVPTRINCVANPGSPGCIRPLGGFTQWEASIELRFAMLYPFTLVLFADAADVSREIGRLQFQYPHLSVGPGVRYESPVGPIRLDLGIRIPGLQALGHDRLPGDGPNSTGSLTHGQERPFLFERKCGNQTCGFPAALQLAIGEAF
jgi:outer membrane translocation and assembly module TamA